MPDKKYFALIRRLPLRPLWTRGDQKAGMKILTELMSRPEESLTLGEKAYLSILGGLLADLEKKFIDLDISMQRAGLKE